MFIKRDSIPDYRGRGLLGHLDAFRNDRFDFLLRLARAHPELARIRLSAFRALATSSPALIHSLLVEHADDIEKHHDLRVFAAPLLGEGLLLLEGQPV